MMRGGLEKQKEMHRDFSDSRYGSVSDSRVPREGGRSEWSAPTGRRPRHPIFEVLME